MNKHKIVFLRTILVLMLFFGVLPIVNAGSVRQLHMDDMLKDAEIVFHGSVLKSESRWDESGSLIKTFVEFDIIDIVAGEYSESKLELSFVGGTVNGQVMKAEGLRIPEIGESGVYFVESVSKKLINPLLGWSQGHFLFEKGEDQKLKVMTEKKQPVTSLFNQSTINQKSLWNANDGISRGIANGVSVGTYSDTPMKAEDFKNKLKARIKYLSDLNVK